jgi:arylsulfatase A-like enzyme
LTFNFGKDDYNFEYDRELLYVGEYESHFHWKESKGQPDWRGIAGMAPFFGQIQLLGGKRSNEAAIKALCPDPAAVPLAGCYPDKPEFRESVARHYGCIEYMDTEVRQIFEQLDKAGLRDNTVVLLFADHGRDGLRDKQFCYEGGTQVPLIIVGP